MEYKRLENETDAQLILRICQLKDEIGSWQDVADVLNGITGYSYNECTYRRRFRSLTKSGQVGEPTKEERIKLQTLNLERNRIDRQLYREQLYYEQVHNAVTALPLPEFMPCYDEVETEIEYLLTIADIHYGAKFTSMNNQYSPEIAKERFEYLAGCIIHFIQEHKLAKLHIASLGDEVQGILRLNDIRLNDSSVVKASVEVSRLIAFFLNEISAYAQIEYYHVPTANHSQIRPLNSKPNELAEEDLEYLIGNYVKDLCAGNSRINVNLAKEGEQFIDIPIAGNKVIAMHGHQIKNLDTAIKDLSMIHHDLIDYLVLGHLHSGRSIPAYEAFCSDAEVLLSSSFVGSCPYSDSIMKGSKAAVQIYGIDFLYGHTETYKIILN